MKSGTNLWNHIEELARKKYKKSDLWSLRMVDLIGENGAKIRIAKGHSELNGFVIYGEESAFGTDCKGENCS